MADKWTRIRYDNPSERVARITLARPEAANAQDYLMISELNAALDKAARDDQVRVIVLAADGKHFSSGHDLSWTTSRPWAPNVTSMLLGPRDIWPRKLRCMSACAGGGGTSPSRPSVRSKAR